MTPAAVAVLNTGALQHNLGIVRQYAPAAKISAVIKANAYGHGLLRTARGLQNVDALAVARVEEGVSLRNADIAKRIIVLEGFTCSDELTALLHYQLEAVVHCQQQLQMLEQQALQNRLRVWLKLDTGMNRLGFKTAEFAAGYARLMTTPGIEKPVNIMTHLANADNVQDGKTQQQLALFRQSAADLPGESSIANSAGILAWPMSIAEWVRPGIMLFGVSPFAANIGADFGLQPVMNLYSRLIAVKSIARGESVGYGGQWLSAKATRLGIVAIGYGDGYPRQVASGTPVLVKGVRVPLVGRVSMDMISVDLTAVPEAKSGDPVTLWGEGLAVEEIARHAGTIPYTLLCGITQRVKIVER